MTLAVWNGTAADESSGDLRVLVSPTVTVTDKATGANATLASDRSGTGKSNPFTAGADGSIEFYVKPGRYKIVADDGAGNTATWDNELIGTLHGIDQPADGERPEYDNANDRWVARPPGYLNPEHATDSATDTYVSATNTTPPADGVKITRDFQSANTTTTPTLDGKTMTTRDGSALWAGAVSGVHGVQRDEGADTYLVLEPIPTAANVNNAPVKRDSNGRAKFADPSAAQDVATKNYVDAGNPTLDTEVDATNGGADDLTEIDFTGIKSGANRIVVAFTVVSLSGTDDMLVQIGDSGGVETSAYTSISNGFDQSGGSDGVDLSSGFAVRAGAAGNLISGVLVLERQSGNRWVSNHSMKKDSVRVITGGGSKELSAELDRIRITTTGTDTFDGGTLNIMVE